MMCIFQWTIQTESLFKNNNILEGRQISILYWSSITRTVPCFIQMPCRTEQSKYHLRCLYCSNSVHNPVFVNYTNPPTRETLDYKRYDFFPSRLPLSPFVYQAPVYQGLVVLHKYFTISKLYHCKQPQIFFKMKNARIFERYRPAPNSAERMSLHALDLDVTPFLHLL